MEFPVEDCVMVPIRLELFPYEVVRQLQAHNEVLKWVVPNAYDNDFPSHYESSSAFNVVDLVTYKGPRVIAYDTFNELSHDPIKIPMTHPTPPNHFPTRKEHIDVTLDELIVSIRDGGVQRYLIRWKEWLESDCT
jgi:hypothetical protein